PGGYLFIGHSESLNRNESGYKYIMPAVYRKE
ncbi:MAG: chemotaxis protein CheR, partial [Clostridiaceae bacterium]|nr:chemotaxis protein CheR [Clostridiaceae bacterium]